MAISKTKSELKAESKKANQKSSLIAALEAEKRRVKIFNLKDSRIKDIDAELAKLGKKPKEAK